MISKKQEIENKYMDMIRELMHGKSMHKLAAEKKICIKNLRRQLKKRYPEQYDKLIYGEIIEKKSTFELRQIPKNQTDATETIRTKVIKEYFKTFFNSINEVGIWKKNESTRLCIDIYCPKYKIGWEIYWRHKETIKQIINRLERYEQYFNRVGIILVKDSRFHKQDKGYFYLQEALNKKNFPYILFDIAEPPSPDTLTLLMEGEF